MGGLFGSLVAISALATVAAILLSRLIDARGEVKRLEAELNRLHELPDVTAQSQRALAALHHDLQTVTLLTAGPGMSLPSDAQNCLRLIQNHIQRNFEELGRREVVEHQLREDLRVARQSLQELSRRIARRGKEPSAPAGVVRALSDEPGEEALEELAQQTAAKLQLKAARAELEELRARFGLAQRTITALERQLIDAHTDEHPVLPALVPDELGDEPLRDA
ncbi:hypothetical protein L6R49_00155 [Myxococcota bacterium]|nr:hypothetical protein [Myxococcota bacterium]